jgi:hypothetical protein
MKDEFSERLKRTINTEDGFIIDGKRTIIPPWGKCIPVSELIGATITEIHAESQTFEATISEKTIRAECNDNDGITISSIQIDATGNESTKAIPMTLKNYCDNGEDEE